MLVTQSRPRNLRWFYAGPLLFGDWGTSRLYVLGLAFYYTAHASALYLAAMSILMAGVAWSYTIICRCFQEGGGVYTVARQLSPSLSVFGGTLLLCDYIVTAALSVVDGMHYFGIRHDQHLLTVALAIGVIGVLGVINWFGARAAGRFALIVAIAALVLSFVVAMMCLPFFREGLKTISLGHGSVSGSWDRWQSFVRIVLALSGVEAVANMTGLMKQPVPRTAKRTIWPVLIEVVVLNMVFVIALSGVPQPHLLGAHQPDYVTYEVQQNVPSDSVPDEVKGYRDTAVKVLAVEAGNRVAGPATGRAMGLISAVVFGLLLLSAVNTAIMAMVSVLFSMAQDKELPRPLAKLNYSGVPWVPLLVACAVPSALLLFMSDVSDLAELYAVGVCGAVTISVLGCVVNRALPIARWERVGMALVGAVMFLIELTIILTKREAALFAGVLILVVLGTRQVMIWSRRPEQALPEPATGWLSELKFDPRKLDMSRPKIMLAARGRFQAEFAVELARKRGANLFAIFVRTLRVIDVQPGRVPRVEEDPEALEALGTAAVLAHQANVPFVPIYVTSADVAGEILDFTATYGCDTLIMGKSRRSLFARTLQGDIVAQVADQLPDDVALMTRSAETPHPTGEDLRAELEANGKPAEEEQGPPPT
jgi:amino acid transporter/nucleotide-binding universal stress UspA family protein